MFSPALRASTATEMFCCSCPLAEAAYALRRKKWSGVKSGVALQRPRTSLRPSTSAHRHLNSNASSRSRGR